MSISSYFQQVMLSDEILYESKEKKNYFLDNQKLFAYRRQEALGKTRI